MRTRTPLHLICSFALVGGLSLTGCKKEGDSEPPDEAAEGGGDEGAAGLGEAGEGGEGDDLDDEGGGEPISFEDFQETADYRTHTVIGCYNTQFGEKKDAPQGKLEVQITVAGDGAVTGAEVLDSSTLSDPELDKCAVEEIKRWKFDETGASEEVTHPFTFDFRVGELLK